MTAFNFPEPPVENGTEVTNSQTGATYRYDLATDSWTIVSTNLVTDIDSQLSGLSGEISRIDSEMAAALTERDELIENAIANNDSQDERIAALEAGGDPSLTYLLGTDKNGNPSSSTPAIELVDSDGNFSNVKFEATGGLLVSSSGSSIIFDGSAIDVDVDLDNYYTKAEVDQVDQHLQDQVDELTVTKGVAAVYTLNDIGIQVGIRPGDFYIDNTVAKSVSFLALAPTDNNGNDRPLGQVGDIIELVSSTNRAYRYEITTASDGVAGVTFEVSADPDDLLIPGTTFSIYIYPQNKTTASIDYVDSRLDTKLSKSGGLMSGAVVMGGSANQIMTNNSFIRFGWGDVNTSEEYGGYVYMRDANTFEVGAYADKTLKFIGQPLFDKSPKVPEPSEDLHAANKKWVNDKLVDYYKKFGGEYIEGHVNITNGKTIRIDKTEGDKQFQIYPASGDGAYGTTVYAYNDGSFTLRLAEGQQQTPYVGIFDARKQSHTVGGTNLTHKTSISYLQTPTKPDHAANKQYVDDKVAGVVSVLEVEDAEPDIHYGDSAPVEAGNGDLWVDTSQMRLLMRVNGAWVNPDREDSSVDLSEYQKVVSPPGRKFKKLNATTPNTDGSFTYYEQNGQVKLGLNRRDAEGTKWLDISFTDSLNAPVLFRIIQWQNDTSHKTVRYGAIDKIEATDGGQIVCDVKYHQTNGSLTNGSNYFIIIGGLI